MAAPPLQESDAETELTRGDGENIEGSSTTTKERRNRGVRGIDKILNYMRNKEKNKTTITPDDIDLFFASAAQSVRKLPRRLQNKVKMAVLNSISMAEEENEWYSNTASNNWVRQTPIPTPSPADVISPSTSSSHTDLNISPLRVPTTSQIPFSPNNTETCITQTERFLSDTNANWEN